MTSKKKIFYILSVFLLLGMTMSVLNVNAHSPINIDLNYDVDTEILTIRLTHGVSDPKVHYINKIEVWVNVTQVWEYEHDEHTYYYFNDSVPDEDGVYHENYGIAVDPSEVPFLPSAAPTKVFNYTEQPTHITPITTSHTLPIYYIPLPGLQETGTILATPIDEFGDPVGYLGEGRTNITVKIHCNLKVPANPYNSTLTEHYYVGQPYFNPHLTFAEAAAPATISTIIVFALLFILPKAGQKSAPKLKEVKIKH